MSPVRPAPSAIFSLYVLLPFVSVHLFYLSFIVTPCLQAALCTVFTNYRKYRTPLHVWCLKLGNGTCHSSPTLSAMATHLFFHSVKAVLISLQAHVPIFLNLSSPVLLARVLCSSSDAAALSLSPEQPHMVTGCTQVTVLKTAALSSLPYQPSTHHRILYNL